MFETLKLKKRANNGDVESMRALIKIYQSRGNSDAAFYWVKKAAEAGDIVSMKALADFYPEGEVCHIVWTRRYERAIKIRELSKLDLASILMLPNFNEIVNDGLKSIDDYIDLLENKAEECDNALDLVVLALKFNGSEGSLCNDKKKYFRWISKAAEIGNSSAQFLLALLYNGNENSLCKDDEKYLYWLTKSAEQGCVEAQFALFISYNSKDERCIENNPEKMIYWLIKAAEQGHPEAELCLAAMYITGDNFEKDMEKGIELLKKAADQGQETAIELLHQLNNE